jgi:hypothetical protein
MALESRGLVGEDSVEGAVGTGSHIASMGRSWGGGVRCCWGGSDDGGADGVGRRVGRRRGRCASRRGSRRRRGQNCAP